VPQLYYGDEILMTGVTSPNDGNVRHDFKGGWTEDKVNKFTEEGRTAKENDIFNFLRTLARYRQQSSAITSGKLMQYVPADGVYTYFRYDGKQTIMVVMNTVADAKNIDMNRFRERTTGFTTGKSIINGSVMSLEGKKTIPGRTIWIYELSK
jgi:neopullulanase